MYATFVPSGEITGTELRRLVSLVSARGSPAGDPSTRTGCAQI
jgi:hypothetical protein